MNAKKAVLVTLLSSFAVGCFDSDEFVCDSEAEVGDVICVEVEGRAPSCWMKWEDGWAQVAPECQANDAVDAGAWSPGVDQELDEWGPVVCHEIYGTDAQVCLLDGQIMLVLVDGEWEPVTTDTIEGKVVDAC